MHSTHPLFPSRRPSNTCAIHLGPDTCPVYEETSDPTRLGEYVRRRMTDEEAVFGVGGYMEERAIYRQGGHFGEGEQARCIHLGVDFWAKKDTAIHAPWDAVVHSLAAVGVPYDYGHVIILRHPELEDGLHSLYGHLSADSLRGIEVGMPIAAGAAFARIGGETENGGWPPHLHFQLIRDMEGMTGNYTGVCAKKDRPFYRNNCPDPALFFSFL